MRNFFGLHFLLIIVLSVSGCDSKLTEATSNNQPPDQNKQIVNQQPLSNKLIKPELSKPKTKLIILKNLPKNPNPDTEKDRYQPYFDDQDYADFDPDDEYDLEQIYYLDQLKNSNDPEMRIKAVAELDESDNRVLQPLQQAMDDSELDVRIKVLEKLSEIELYGAINSIVKALDDPEDEVVIAAINAIENIADESLLFQLEPLLQHPNDKIQLRTEEVMEMLN